MRSGSITRIPSGITRSPEFTAEESQQLLIDHHTESKVEEIINQKELHSFTLT